MKAGVLALQGAFIEHEKRLSELGVTAVEIRQPRDLSSFDCLILPGGESTTMGKLLHDLELFDPIREMIQSGTPVMGTCAGLLLLAKKIENDDRRHLALMDITAVRNAYGRQLGSFHTEAEFNSVRIPMTFIRAPYIKAVGDGAAVLAEVDGKIVAAREKNMLVAAFHPELDRDNTVYEYFLNMTRQDS